MPAAAGDKDVQIAGAASTVQPALNARVLDELQIHLAPVVLGAGTRLFDGVEIEESSSSSPARRRIARNDAPAVPDRSLARPRCGGGLHDGHCDRSRNTGRAIGTRFVAGGHEVEIVDRDPAEARKSADELGGSATALEAGGPFGGQVVVFAVYYPWIKDAVQQYRDRLTGTVVVDITNPVDTQTWDRLRQTPVHRRPRRSALVPHGAQVVKGQRDARAYARGRGGRTDSSSTS
jgi:F420-dependent NADP oxidoreductase-like protein/RibD domain-containing protein